MEHVQLVYYSHHRWLKNGQTCYKDKLYIICVFFIARWFIIGSCLWETECRPRNADPLGYLIPLLNLYIKNISVYKDNVWFSLGGLYIHILLLNASVGAMGSDIQISAHLKDHYCTHFYKRWPTILNMYYKIEVPCDTMFWKVLVRPWAFTEMLPYLYCYTKHNRVHVHVYTSSTLTGTRLL